MERTHMEKIQPYVCYSVKILACHHTLPLVLHFMKTPLQKVLHLHYKPNVSLRLRLETDVNWV